MKHLTHIPKFITAAFFCIAVSPLFAQYECSITQFNTEDGLPNNEITALTMDYDGYVWVGTRNGLVRYDGSRLKTFELDRETPGKQFTNQILDVLNIPFEQRVIIKTRSNNFYLIQDGRPVFKGDSTVNGVSWYIYSGNFPSLNSLLTYVALYRESFTCASCVGSYRETITIDKNTFIIGCPGCSTLIYFKDGIQQRTVDTRLKLDKLFSSAGHHFLMDLQHNFYLYDETNERFNKIKINWSILKNNNSSSSDCRFYYDPFSNETFCFLNATIYLLRYDADGNVMNFVPQFLMPYKGLLCTDILYDSTSSTFFISTVNEGFFQVKLKKIKTINTVEKLPKEVSSAVVYAILATSDSTVVIPSGLQITDGSNGLTTKRLGNLYGKREVLGLLKDKSILVSMDADLYSYSKKDGYRSRQVYNDSFNTLANPLILLLYPEGDSVWVMGKDFFSLTGNKLNAVAIDKSIAAEIVDNTRLFFRINNEEVFLGAERGLYLFKSSYPYSITPVPEMKDKQVRHILPYKNMFILSTYKKGLYLLKDKKFHVVPGTAVVDGFPSAHATYIDNRGFIWITTDRGLFKSTIASLIESAVNPQSGLPYFFRYGKADGIDNLEFNGRGMPTYGVLKNGRVFFPSMGGVVTFMPEDIADKMPGSAPLVEKVLIDGTERNETDSVIRLKAGFKFIAFELVTPFFGDPANIKFDYKMDDGGWQQVPLVSNMHWVTLVDISAGRHTLMIRKRTGFGKEDYAYTTVYIYRAKHLYEKPWFYIAVVALTILLIWLFLRLKTQNLNRKRKELQKKVDEQTAELSKAGEVKDLLISIISHDMVSPLRHVGTVAKVLKMGLEKDPEKITEALSDIQSTSEKILEGSTTIISWMKYNNKRIDLDKKTIHLYDLVNNILEMYMPIARSKNIVLVNDVATSEFVSADNNILSIILTNLVSNAIKYTDEGSVRVFAEKLDKGAGAIVKIADTGRGMNEQKLNTIRDVLKGNLHFIQSADNSSGLGYVMIAELSRIHHLELQIESKMDKGTTISLIIN